MRIALPDLDAPATLILDPSNRFSDDEYFDFCMAETGTRPASFMVG
jgi:hypothetical protein